MSVGLGNSGARSGSHETKDNRADLQWWTVKGVAAHQLNSHSAYCWGVTTVSGNQHWGAQTERCIACCAIREWKCCFLFQTNSTFVQVLQIDLMWDVQWERKIGSFTFITASSHTEMQIGATPVGPLVLSFTPADGGSLLYLSVASCTVAPLPCKTIQTHLDVTHVPTVSHLGWGSTKFLC